MGHNYPYEVHSMKQPHTVPIRLTEDEWQACRKVLMEMRKDRRAELLGPYIKPDWAMEYEVVFDKEE